MQRAYMKQPFRAWVDRWAVALGVTLLSGVKCKSEEGPVACCRVHPAPGAAPARWHHRALPADPGPQVQPGQDDLPQVSHGEGRAKEGGRLNVRNKTFVDALGLQPDGVVHAIYNWYLDIVV